MRRGRPTRESPAVLRAEMSSSEALERMIPYLPAGDVWPSLRAGNFPFLAADSYYRGQIMDFHETASDDESDAS